MEEGLLTRGSHTRALLLPRSLLKSLVLSLVLCCTFSIASIQIFKLFGAYNSSITAITPSLVPSDVENSGNLGRRIDPPSNPMHNMSDRELFSRAVSTARLDTTTYWFDRNPKVAFMFLTKGGLPLSPLWERFFKGHEGRYSIYIHSSPSYRADFPPESVFYKRQIPSQVSEWGKTSMCDAERRLLANALLDISNRRFVLLSESCIPLHNFSVIHAHITRSRRSFVASFDEPGPQGRGRYNATMSPAINATQWRKGSQWFEADRDLALHIVRDTKFYSKFAESCRPPCYADEHYLPTMLTAEAAGALANRSVTWVDWSRGGPPATFGGADITEGLLRRIYEGKKCLYNDEISSVCHLFARKFAPSALQALFLIAPKYLGF